MTLDQARLLAGARERASRLFADGYRANEIDDHRVEIVTPEGATYEVDTLSLTCGCYFYQRHATCKHVLGCEQLLADQERARREALLP